MFNFLNFLSSPPGVSKPRRGTRRPRMEPLESRRCMAGEVVSLHLNARTPDDRPLTDVYTREATVNVGDVFYLEISYEDLRAQTLTRAPGGAFQLKMDVAIAPDSGLEPVLLERQRLSFSGNVRNASQGNILVHQEGNENPFTFSILSDFSEGLAEALIAFGYNRDQFAIDNYSTGVGDIVFDIQFTDFAFDRLDLPEISLTFDLYDPQGQTLDIASSTDSTPPLLGDGTVNPASTVNSFDYRSRTFLDNFPYYDLRTFGTYQPAFGFRSVGGVASIGQFNFGGLSDYYPEGFPSPFDFLSIPVLVTSPFDSIPVAVALSTSDESLLLFPYGPENPPNRYDASDVLLGDFSQLNIRAFPADLTEVGDRRFFASETDDGQRELFATTGDLSSASLVIDLSDEVSSAPEALTAFGDELFFTALTSSGQRELYHSDGTRDGTRILRNLSLTTSSDPRELTVVGDHLYFTAERTSGTRELYVTNGTFESTHLVRDFSGQLDSDPRELTAVGDLLYFTAVTTSGDRELYVTDGTREGSRRVRDLSGATSSDPQDLTPLGDQVFFTALTPSGERELHVTDSTTQGTRLVRNIAGTASSDPRELTAVGDLLAFIAATVTGERELFRSDGTVGGTVLVTNLRGDLSANPHQLQAHGDRLWFFIDGEHRTRELYRSNLRRNGTLPVDSPTSFASDDVSVASTNQRLVERSQLREQSSPILVTDVSEDGTVTALDALIIINALSALDPDQLLFDLDMSEEVLRMDVNQDGRVTAADALMVINHTITSATLADRESGLLNLENVRQSDWDFETMF